MHYKVFHLVFAFFYWSGASTSGQSIDNLNCSSPLHYCMMKSDYRALSCGDGPVSVTDGFLDSNQRWWPFYLKGNPFCGQSTSRIVNLDQSMLSRIHSLHSKGDRVVTFVCRTNDACLWKISILHVLSMPDLLNVSLVYHGNQVLGERGKLTCTIDWARNDTWIRKTWLKRGDEIIGSSQTDVKDDDVATSQEYALVFYSLKRKNAREYQCGANGLAFNALSIQVTASVVIDIRTRVARSIHAITSTSLSPSLESSMSGSTENGTWTLTETTNSSMAVPSFSNFRITSSTQSPTSQRTQPSASYSLYESPSTLESRLSSSRQRGVYSSHSQSNTSKSQFRPTKVKPSASKSRPAPTKVKPIVFGASASTRLLPSMFIWHLFVSGSLVMCSIDYF